MSTPFRAFTPLCRSCSRPMQVADEIGQCHGCGGWWLTEATLRRIHREQSGQDLPELLEHEDGRPSRACPICADRMPHVFLEMIPLDRCPEHGIWLDRGEVEAVLAWRPGAKSPQELGFDMLPELPKLPGRKR